MPKCPQECRHGSHECVPRLLHDTVSDRDVAHASTIVSTPGW